MTIPILLDLFCCEGGASTGYHQAGFDVIGVDIDPQPNYPFAFLRADAMTLLERMVQGVAGIAVGVSVIAASPPCQSYTTMTNRHASSEPELIEPVRDLLRATGLPYVIENVGARRHMESPMMLHGGMFGLDVYRPRLFESNMLLTPPPAAPKPANTVAVYGRKEDRRRLWTRQDGTELRAASLDEARRAMEMPWASWNGCREAIPPAYTRWIGEQLIDQLERAA